MNIHDNKAGEFGLIEPVRKLTLQQLKNLKKRVFNDSPLPPLSYNSKKQFAQYMIDEANSYTNTHSMNRTILVGTLKSLFKL